ncbi:hypothetical protein D3C87_1196700 [compost metagenome]
MPGLSRKVTLFIAVSLALHILVALVLILKPQPSEPLPTQVEFEIIPTQESPGKLVAPGDASVKAQGTQSGSAPIESGNKIAKDILSDGSKISLDKAGTSKEGETVFGEGVATNNVGSGAWVEQVNVVKAMELTTFLQRIKEKIDLGLDYPEDMAVQRISGEVRLDFYVDRKGRLTGDFHSVKGAESLLNLYVMSSLLVLLKEPLPENLWAQEDRIAISVHVDFATYQFTETRIRNQASFQANQLVFRRARYVQPLAVAKVEKIFTRYIPPIIPLPGGFYVDFIMLAKYIQNINTPDPDDQRKQRLGLTRESLELATKKKEVFDQ